MPDVDQLLTYTVIVIGSPSPKQQAQLQFASAAERHASDPNTLWLVERTGYEAYGLPLKYFERYAPSGRLVWLTPEHGLVDAINSMPARSIRQMFVYSHGEPGLVALRYGWNDQGLRDYGLDDADVTRVDPSKFASSAFVQFDSCNMGTGDVGNIAQDFANRIQQRVTAWTGRTSYSAVNRGTGDVRPSTAAGLWETIKEKVWSQWILGRVPRLVTFEPIPRQTEYKRELMAPRTRRETNRREPILPPPPARMQRSRPPTVNPYLNPLNHMNPVHQAAPHIMNQIHLIQPRRVTTSIDHGRTILGNPGGSLRPHISPFGQMGTERSRPNWRTLRPPTSTPQPSPGIKSSLLGPARSGLSYVTWHHDVTGNRAISKPTFHNIGKVR